MLDVYWTESTDEALRSSIRPPEVSQPPPAGSPTARMPGKAERTG